MSYKKEENKFTNENVIPYLVEELRHKIIKSNEKIKYKDFDQEVDVLSSDEGGRQFVTEVKSCLGDHQLQTAIGQLVLHKIGRGDDVSKTVYQIVFPKKCEKCSGCEAFKTCTNLEKDKRPKKFSRRFISFSQNLRDYLNELDITIEFI